MTARGGRRRPGLGPEVRERLRQAYGWDCSDGEACFWAGITEEELEAHLKSDPGLAEEIKGWRLALRVDSKRALAEAVKSDPKKALEYLKLVEKAAESGQRRVKRSMSRELRKKIDEIRKQAGS